MRHFSCVLLASLAVAATLQAQGHPQTRKGFTISFGFGAGSAEFSCDGCSSDRQTSGSSYLRIGGDGVGSINTSVETGAGTLSNSKSGVGYNAGLGYDIRLKRNFSITPFATYFATSAGNSGSLYGGGGNKVDAKIFHFGIGFTWH